MADFQRKMGEARKKKKGVLKNKKTFVMIYCFARAQPKPTKREEEENTTTNARQKASRQQSGGQAGRQVGRPHFIPPLCVSHQSRPSTDLIS